MVTFTDTAFPYTVHLNCRPLRWWKKLGITFGRHVFLAARVGEVRAEVLAHEYAHVLQWRYLGVFRFAWNYLSGLVLYGYGLKHPMEREAYDYAVAYMARFVGHADFLNRAVRATVHRAP